MWNEIATKVPAAARSRRRKFARSSGLLVLKCRKVLLDPRWALRPCRHDADSAVINAARRQPLIKVVKLLRVHGGCLGVERR